jgi:hypothetical protein
MQRQSIDNLRGGKFATVTPGADPVRKSAKQPRQVGQLICLHAGQPGDPMVADAAHRMLQGKLADEWLGRDQGLRAAMWLKIVWDYLGCDKPPHQVLLCL